MHEARYQVFNAGPHQTNAKILLAALIVQLVLGVFLKAQLYGGNIRHWVVRIHGAVGMMFPILGWSQFLCGVIASRNFCRGDTNFPECITFYIMV